MIISRRNTVALGLGVGVGVVVLGVLFAWRGFETVAGLLAEAGFGLLVVCVLAVPDQILSAEAWRCLFPPASRPG
ncbi:MAG: hypothetical protein ACE5GT_06575 [Rhodospirillales bacterium]